MPNLTGFFASLNCLLQLYDLMLLFRQPFSQSAQTLLKTLHFLLLLLELLSQHNFFLGGISQLEEGILQLARR